MIILILLDNKDINREIYDANAPFKDHVYFALNTTKILGKADIMEGNVFVRDYTNIPFYVISANRNIVCMSPRIQMTACCSISSTLQ